MPRCHNIFRFTKTPVSVGSPAGRDHDLAPFGLVIPWKGQICIPTYGNVLKKKKCLRGTLLRRGTISVERNLSNTNKASPIHI